jgi:hypothetical protein
VQSVGSRKADVNGLTATNTQSYRTAVILICI